MEQFNLNTWLKDKSRKVTTRDGRTVRIVCWDLKCNTPIIAAIQWNQEREDCYCYNAIGRCANNVAELDLFFADEKENLSEDEKIRKSLIKSYTNQHQANFPTVDGFTREQILVWLEKHGEQKTVSKTEPIVEGLTTEFQKQVSHLIASVMDKEHEYTKGYIEWVAQSLLGYAKNEQTSTNNVEPKFKVGDWIVTPTNVTKQIEKVTDLPGNHFQYWTTDGFWFGDGTRARLWTIQDAKDGDVIDFNDGHGNDSIELIKIPTDKKIEIWFCLTNDNDYEVFDGITPYTNFSSRENATPATKEHRDILFTKMKEAGYEWDAEKKELKKIEQNQEWSEEDESHIGRILSYLESFKAYNAPHIEPIKKEIDWLKSIKKRIKGK